MYFFRASIAHVTALHDSGRWTDAEIAERVGHTVAVLRATYVNVFHGRDGGGRREALAEAFG